MANMEAGGRGASDEGSILVCMTCGREAPAATAGVAPSDIRCEKCGSQVFRAFDAGTDLDEVRQEFVDETDRDLKTDDPAGDATPGDLHDLNP
jgi:DNA-directed RNA polymerase subunit RPC12/RpoP